MANEANRLQRQKASADYLKMRNEYRANLADLEIVIKDEDYADKTTGLLNGPRLRNGLQVYIPPWTNTAPPGASDKVELFLDTGSGAGWVPVGEHEFTAAADGSFPETFPYEMTVDTNHLPDDATCKLYYKFTDYTDWETDSSETTVICDRMPPYKHTPPAVLKLSSEYLDDANLPDTGQLTVTIPGYPDWKDSDKIAIYLVDAASIPDDPTTAPLMFFGSVPSPGTTDTPVQIPAAKIRDFGDAECVLLYVLIDKAENPSAVSVNKNVSLTFGPLPDNLTPPRVPQAVPGPLLNEHVRVGVSVWIDKYDNWKAGDKVRVTWGATRVEPDLDFVDMPTMEVPVLPAQLMLLEYGQPTVMAKSQLVHGGAFLPADGFFTAVQLCGNLSAGQTLDEQSYHFQFTLRKIHALSSSAGGEACRAIENVGKGRAYVVCPFFYYLHRPFQLYQRAAFVEQATNALPEQGLQQGGVVQHGHHDQRDMAKVTAQITHECQTVRKASIRHRIVTDQ